MITVLRLIYLKCCSNLSKALKYCLITPGRTCGTEFLIKFICEFFVLLFVICMMCLIRFETRLPQVSTDSLKILKSIIKGGVVAPLLENAVMLVFCRIGLRFKIPPIWISLSWGVLFGYVHVFQRESFLASVTIISFAIQAGMYLNWYQTRNAYLITVLYHALNNLLIDFTAISLTVYFN